MGDRGGTATRERTELVIPNYTRWEIGGEPQPAPQPRARSQGGEPQQSARPSKRVVDYTRWEIGGEPQLYSSL